jgi:hypothetical protein
MPHIGQTYTKGPEEKEINTNNLLIAEFMEQDVTLTGLRRNVMVKSYYLHELEYHKSWSWLMPVVEKIATIKHVQQVSVSTLKTRIWFDVSSMNSFVEVDGDSMIQKCYNTVVDFVKWYNQQSK